MSERDRFEALVQAYGNAVAMHEGVGEARAALLTWQAALADSPEPAQPVAHWRHVKRGTTYVTAGQAMAQCSTGPINDGDTTQVYRGADGGLYVRKVEEFQDGRFERIAAPVARPERRQRR